MKTVIKCYICSQELDLEHVSDIRHVGWERLTHDRTRAEYRCPKHRQTNPQFATIGDAIRKNHCDHKFLDTKYCIKCG